MNGAGSFYFVIGPVDWTAPPRIPVIKQDGRLFDRRRGQEVGNDCRKRRTLGMWKS